MTSRGFRKIDAIPIALICVGFLFFLKEILAYSQSFFPFLPRFLVSPTNRIDLSSIFLCYWLILYGYYSRKGNTKNLLNLSIVLIALWGLNCYLTFFGVQWIELYEGTLFINLQTELSRDFLFYLCLFFSLWTIHNSVQAPDEAFTVARMLRKGWERYSDLLVPAFLIVNVAIVYWPLLGDSYFRSDDFGFLSKIVRHGLLPSLLIPHNGHFLPLYRLSLGPLYLLFKSAVPIRILILIFHFINIYLIFYIVRKHTGSVVLSAIASLMFGLSYAAASCILWSINGHWGMSLTFILLMSLSFERFLKPIVQVDHSEGISQLATTESSSSLPLMDLKHYHIGLVFFVISLSLFTNALLAGILVWLYMCMRIFPKIRARQSFSHYLAIVFPFLVITASYLAIVYFVNSTMTASARPDVSLTHFMEALKLLPLDFYVDAAKGFFPSVDQYHMTILLLIILLVIVKELSFRSAHQRQIIFWIILAFLTFLLPVAGRLPLLVSWDPLTYKDLLDARYYCFPIAALSIAMGLLLNTSAALQKSTVWRVLLIAILIGVVALSHASALDIKEAIEVTKAQDVESQRIIVEYRNAMSSFLDSRGYSADKTYYIRDGQVLPFVRRSYLFILYFQGIDNVYFLDPEQEKQNVLYWSKDDVSSEESNSSAQDECVGAVGETDSTALFPLARAAQESFSPVSKCTSGSTNALCRTTKNDFLKVYILFPHNS